VGGLKDRLQTEATQRMLRYCKHKRAVQLPQRENLAKGSKKTAGERARPTTAATAS
jgi:hypothetical protein